MKKIRPFIDYEKFDKLLERKGITAYRVAKDLGISPSTLSDWKVGRSVPKADKIQLIADYFGIDSVYFYNDETPVFNVAGGQGAYNETYPSEFMDSQEDGYSFARVRGDSMSPVICDGDIVKVHHQSETKPSDYTVVKINGDEVTVKHVEIVDNGVWLRAENKEVFPDKFYSIQDVMTLPVTIIGKAVEVRRSL